MLTEPSEIGQGALVSRSFLANRQFLLLAGGQWITNTTVALYTTLLMVWVFVLTGSGTATSAVLVATILPGCVIGPVAGVFIDRWNRKTTLLLSTVAQALVVLLPVFATSSTRLPVIFAAALLLSACSCFFMPAKSGALQVLVPEEHYTQAAYWSAGLFTMGYVCGAALASPLYFTVGPQVVLWMVAALFLLSTGILAGIRLPRTTRRSSSGKEPGSLAHGLFTVGRELLEGILFVVRTRSLCILLLSTILIMASASVFNAINIVFVTHRLHVPTQLIGPINVSISVGTLLGFFLAGVLVKWIPPKALFAGGMVLVGVGLTLYSFLTTYSLALVVVGAAVLPQSGVDVGLGPIMIHNTPNAIIGRVQSVIETSNLTAGLLAAALAALIVQLVDLRIIFAGVGLLALLAGMIAWFGLPGQGIGSHAIHKEEGQVASQ